MKYFIDTEFIEGFRKPISWLPTIGGFNKPYHSIELISIGIAAEDGRSYYAISKEFDLKEAWNKFDIKTDAGKPQGLGDTKVFWLRDNVLAGRYEYENDFYFHEAESWFDLNTTRRLINVYGKSRMEMAVEIWEFVIRFHTRNEKGDLVDAADGSPVEFYAYFADYDWVVFCSIFGRMMDLPPGFPMYCRGLKQTLDEKVESKNWLYGRDVWSNRERSLEYIGNGYHQETDRPATFEEKLKLVKELHEYPQQENEHNALADAKWNKRLFDFLQKF